MIWLLDGNALVALVRPGHVHQDRVHRWLVTVRPDVIATCPVTEGTLLRLQMMQGSDPSAVAAWSALAALRTHPRHVFWADNFSYTEITPDRLTGHRQVTDSWLAALAGRKSGKLATLDEALSALWPETVVLIPV
jgi:toxin-antitoxin system PIN domain toxin